MTLDIYADLFDDDLDGVADCIAHSTPSWSIFLLAGIRVTFWGWKVRRDIA